MDLGESVRESLGREVREETGLEIHGSPYLFGVYSGAEGTEIQLNPGGPTYTLTYQFDDGDDIGLIPEPATMLLLGIGAVVLLRKRR